MTVTRTTTINGWRLRRKG